MAKAKTQKTPTKGKKKILSDAGTTITKEFTVKLTDKDLASKMKESAGLSGEIEDLEQKLDGIKKDFQAQIRDREVKRDEIARATRAGSENRMLEVLMIKNYDAGMIQYFHGGKLMEERAMTFQERQVDLPLKEKKATQDTKVLVTDPASTTKKATKGKTTVMSEAFKKAEAQRHAQEAKRTKSFATGKTDVGQVISEETGRKTKRSSVDGVYQ